MSMISSDNIYGFLFGTLLLISLPRKLVPWALVTGNISMLNFNAVDLPIYSMLEILESDLLLM